MPYTVVHASAVDKGTRRGGGGGIRRGGWREGVTEGVREVVRVASGALVAGKIGKRKEESGSTKI